MTSHKLSQAITKAMGLAITCAQKKSPRAGIGWVLLDKKDRHLYSDGIVAGIDGHRLYSSIDQYSDVIKTLVITTPIIASFLGPDDVWMSIKNSSCERLVFSTINHAIYYDYTNNIDWDGDCIPFNIEPVSSLLLSGQSKVLTEYRPWITSVSAANMKGAPLRLSDLSDEFGFTPFLDELSKQTRAVLYSSSQASTVKLLSDSNYAREKQEFYEIDNIKAVKSILRHCAAEHRYSVTIIAHTELQVELMKNSITDEVIHHVAIVSDTNTSEPNTTPYHLPTEGWHLSSTTAVGNCCRLHLAKQVFSASGLGQRFN